MNFFTRITVVACLLAASLLPCTHAAATCQPGQTSACASCMSIGSCTSPGQPVVEAGLCPDDQVCSIINNQASCVDPIGTTCACDPFTLSCDKYDPYRVMVCVSKSVPPASYAPSLVQVCPSNAMCSGGKCASPTTTSTTTPTTTSTTTPTTTSTTTSTTTPMTTTSTTSTTTPTTTTSTTPTTTTSTTPTTTTTTTPTTTTTTTSTTTPTTTTTITPTTTPTTMPTTTPTLKPPTCNAANANKKYPHETDCKKYYTCRLTTATAYAYVPSTCPSTYLFNRTTGYCDLPANVVCS